MKRFLYIFSALTLMCFLMSGKPEVSDDSYYGFFKRITRGLDVEYRLEADDSLTVALVPYKDDKRNGTQINLAPIYPHSDNRRIILQKISNFRNDTLMGTCLLFDSAGNIKAIISQIKVNTDFIHDQYVMFGDTNAIIYQGFCVEKSSRNNIPRECWILFTEDNLEMQDNEVGIGYRNNRSDTIDFSRNRVLEYRALINRYDPFSDCD